MEERLEVRCKNLIINQKYETCEKEIINAMAEMPHSAMPHNLMGILLEKKQNHLLAMKHFRAACDLEPTYIPARCNLEQYGAIFSGQETGNYVYLEEECPVHDDSQFTVAYDEHHVGHLVRR